MQTIYPPETLALLAKYDALIREIIAEYQRPYPKEDWQRRMLEDPYYQACIQQKADIISVSPCTYIFDASEKEIAST